MIHICSKNIKLSSSKLKTNMVARINLNKTVCTIYSSSKQASKGEHLASSSSRDMAAAIN
jgi:hypothetical protein